MVKGRIEPYTLKFITPGGTSRGVLLTKDTYFLHLEKEGKKGKKIWIYLSVSDGIVGLCFSVTHSAANPPSFVEAKTASASPKFATYNLMNNIRINEL